MLNKGPHYSEISGSGLAYTYTIINNNKMQLRDAGKIVDLEKVFFCPSGIKLNNDIVLWLTCGNNWRLML
jgi:hypothetical protein